jgi:Leucine rich repeat
LVLSSNGFSGTIPTTIASLGNLTHLDLSENTFSGRIPHQLSNLITLQYLFFADNSKLQPQVIPTFIGSLTNLRDLSLKGSNRVASIQPSMFDNLKDLVLLELDNNLLTGEVPSELGKLMSMTYLLLNRNSFSGTVPTEIQLLPQLDILLLDKTKLEGSLDTLCSAQRTRQPEITSADCYGDSPELNCTCCNICCADGVNVTECRDRVYFGELDPVWENSYQRRFYQFADQDFGTTSGVSTQSDIGHDDVLGNGSNVTKPTVDDNNTVVRWLSEMSNPRDLGSQDERY